MTNYEKTNCEFEVVVVGLVVLHASVKRGMEYSYSRRWNREKKVFGLGGLVVGMLSRL